MQPQTDPAKSRGKKAAGTIEFHLYAYNRLHNKITVNHCLSLSSKMQTRDRRKKSTQKRMRIKTFLNRIYLIVARLMFTLINGTQINVTIADEQIKREHLIRSHTGSETIILSSAQLFEP